MNNPDAQIDWGRYRNAVKTCRAIDVIGKVVKVAGIVAEGNGPAMGVGGVCAIETTRGDQIQAEVVGFHDNRISIMPYGEMRGIEPGCRIFKLRDKPSVSVGDAHLGRVVDGLGRPLDGKGPVTSQATYSLYGDHINPMKRKIISRVMDVGICSINAMTTVGKGQRLAIMAGSGVGKSVLMGMIAKNTTADVIVIALIGERGREVREFVEHNLGQEGLKKAVVVAATSDTPALARIRGTYLACTLAEYFRDQGRDVVLIMDSITRFAMALREVGLAAGEPPSAKGYTPSVFAQIPKILERAGTAENKGSITGIYTVLVEGDDMNEPIADAVRSCSDGHIVLSRAMAHKGHYPAIDVLASISRVMRELASAEQLEHVQRLVEVLSTYREVEDLINIGAYTDGSDPKIDFAKKMITKVNAFLRQGIHQCIGYDKSVEQLKALFSDN